ncbi:hypothetical protein [Dyella tabacisoli]|uniref:DUF3077 domain-containing protein n=1 Tax=Dyella tabacisoli TaxID=2282381 RepID=A0A369UR51_9GAMM|nr:hypothetical protein [Dyella tabacisoli]RDD82110.1 hypothetical protein DVJ77_08595 [Dyella tabacisoli]
MAVTDTTPSTERIRFSDSYHIDPDATPESLHDDVNEMLDHARAISLALCHSLTPHAEVDFNHLSSVFAAIANMIDMAQSASDHAHMQLQRERVKPKSKPL